MSESFEHRNDILSMINSSEIEHNSALFLIPGVSNLQCPLKVTERPTSFAHWLDLFIIWGCGFDLCYSESMENNP